jgi:hypothetical protein
VLTEPEYGVVEFNEALCPEKVLLEQGSVDWPAGLMLRTVAKQPTEDHPIDICIQQVCAF